MDAALADARRLQTAPYSATYDLIVSDLYGVDFTQPADTKYPCYDTGCSNYITFIDRVVEDVQDSGLSVRFDIMNEGGGVGELSTRWYQIWDAAVTEIRLKMPSAVIVGPSNQGYDPNQIRAFLTHAKAANTLPNVLNWHNGDPVACANSARQIMSDLGITGISLSMNEYLKQWEQTAGITAWYLAQMNRGGISSAAHAVWLNSGVGSLDNILTQDANGNYQPTGQWWVYKNYANVTGNLAAVTSSGSTSAVAGVDAARQRVSVLLGDSSRSTGMVNLSLTGLASTPWLASSDGIRITVQRVTDASSYLPSPTVVTSQVIPSGSATATVPINWDFPDESFFVELTPENQTASTTTNDSATAAAPSGFVYGTGWTGSTGIAGTDGTSHASSTAGTFAQFHFRGTQVQLRALRGSDQGQMYVSVDGSAPTLVDNYATGPSASAVVWSSPKLIAGEHDVVVSVAPTKNAASTGNTITLDSAESLNYEPVDLAAGQTATQSSTAFNAPASRAVDGNVDGNYNDGSVTHTNSEPNAWWRVDLGGSSAITSINVFNRTDAAPDRLSDYYVFVSNSAFNTSLTPAQQAAQPGVWSSHQTSQAGSPTTITLPPGTTGRYVMVQLNGTNYLSLAEVQVFASDLARGRATTQSSTAYGAPASRAVDGNFDSSFYHGSVTHTNSEPNAWWRVDLGGSSAITSVNVFNRTDWAPERLSDYYVFVSNSAFNTSLTPAQQAAQPGVWSSHQTSQAGSPTTITLPPGTTGRYVMVQLNGTNYLSLAEVQVFNASDLAQGRAATQSSTGDGAPASRAVDGNAGGNFFDRTVTETTSQANAWWRVDLGGSSTITSVNVFNRTDAAPDRLSDYYVFVSNSAFNTSLTPAQQAAQPGVWSSHQTSQAGSPTTITLPPGTTGRYVMVQLNGTNYLSLAEVQVFGTTP